MRVFSCIVLCMISCFSIFAQSEDKEFFDEYLHGAWNVKSYEPTYFMPFSVDFLKHDDRDQIEVSFQISFKKDIIKNISPIGFDVGLAFTQTVWWQLYTYSNPVREINYGPELYVNFPFHRKSDGVGLFCHGIKVAAAHKSNGRADDDNRSWNRIYLEAPISVKWFMFIPKVWWSFVGIGNDFTEKDIPLYMGMCDLTIVTRWNSHVLRIYGRSNFDFKDIKAALQIDYSYPIASAGFYFYLKYFLGYGESLIDYKRPVNKIGTGLALSR